MRYTKRKQDSTLDDLLFNSPENLQFVESIEQFPAPINGVITLPDNKGYFITKGVDLQGARIVLGDNNAIMGMNPETCFLASTGLVGQPIISGSKSCTFNNLGFFGGTALRLIGTGPGQQMTMSNVAFFNCSVGLINSFSAIVIDVVAFVNAGNLVLDGILGTIAFSSCLFQPAPGQIAVSLLPTATVGTRFRCIYSVMVILPGATGFNAAAGNFPNAESYVFDTVNFAGGGTYLSGLLPSNIKSQFVNCVGVDNSGNIGNMKMSGNATATVIPAANTFVQFAGTPTLGTFNEKFTFAANNLTFVGPREGFFKVTVTASMLSGNGDTLSIQPTKNGVTTGDTAESTTTAVGKAENVVCQSVIKMNSGDFVSFAVANKTAARNITVQEMNFIVERLN